ncbi:MAG: hypothetical protein ACTS5Y_12720, partial [Pollutimonas bauzanensis]
MGTQYTYRNRRAFQVATLAAALLGVYGASQAAPLVLNDGGTHTVADDAYDYAEVRYASDKTVPTRLDASGLTITDSRIGVNVGAVFAKGGEINLSASTISTTGDKGLGLQAFSARGGEAAT